MTGGDAPSRQAFAAALPAGWSTQAPDERDAAELTSLLQAHESAVRGWASATLDEVSALVSDRGYRTRDHLLVRDERGTCRGWASGHDRATGRMLLDVTVDHDLDDDMADAVASTLFAWADEAARRVAARRGVRVQQVDSGAFALDERQHRWFAEHGFERVREWWQMSRQVGPGDADLAVTGDEGVRIRPVRRTGDGLPDEDDLRAVHDVLESAFADHFNSHEESFDEFVSRLREDPGHRWDHWWIAELVDGVATDVVGALVGSVVPGAGDGPSDSYVEYIGVLAKARGRGVAKSLLHTVIADAAARGRGAVGLEVDADSPSGAEGLYLSMGWRTKYVTESWHRNISLPS